MTSQKAGMASFLPLTGLLLFFLWESCCYLALPWIGISSSVLPVALLAHIGGVLMAGLGLGEGEKVGWSARPIVLLVSGLVGAAACFGAARGLPWKYPLVTGAAFLAGLSLPLLLRQFFRYVPRQRQGLCMGTVHALAECFWLLILPFLTATAAGQTMLLPLLGGVQLLLGCAAGLSACRTDTPPLEVRSSTTYAPDDGGLLRWMGPPFGARPAWKEVFPLLLLLAVCFFLLHALHDYMFLQNTLTTPGVPLWLRVSIRLGFPMLGILVDRGYGTGMFILSLEMSVFSFVMGLLPVESFTYQFVYCLDTLGLHGGMIFLLLVFARCADRARFSGLTRVVPYIIMHGKFALLWLFNAYVSLDFSTLLMLSLGLVAIFLALLPWMEARSAIWHPRKEAPKTDPVLDFAVTAGLSPRETDVLRLIREGLSSTEMARRLYISENTLKVHIGKILKKSGARNRTHLMSMLMASFGSGKG